MRRTSLDVVIRGAVVGLVIGVDLSIWTEDRQLRGGGDVPYALIPVLTILVHAALLLRGRYPRSILALEWTFCLLSSLIIPLFQPAAGALLALHAVAGHDPRDRTTDPSPRPDYPALLAGSIGGMTVGVPTNAAFADVDAEVRARLDASLRALEALGARVIPVELPDPRVIYALTNLVNKAEAAARSGTENLANFLKMLGYMLLFNGFCITLLAYLTIWNVTNETLAKWSELDAVLAHIGGHVNPEIADALGWKILLAGAVVTLAGYLLGRSSGKR